MHKTPKRLALHSETLVNLSSGEVTRVGGGIPPLSKFHRCETEPSVCVCSLDVSVCWI